MICEHPAKSQKRVNANAGGTCEPFQDTGGPLQCGGMGFPQFTGSLDMNEFQWTTTWAKLWINDVP